MILRKLGFSALTVVALTAIPAFASTTPSTLLFGPFPQAAHPFEQFQNTLRSLKTNAKIRALTDRNPFRALTLDQTVSSEEVKTTKFQDYFKGIEVVGSMAFHHEGPNGVQIIDEMKVFDVDTVPTLSADDAVGIARMSMEDLDLDSAPELKIRPSDDGSARLTWKIELKGTFERPGSTLYIDAHSGDTLANLPDHIEAISAMAPVTIKTADDNCQLVYEVDSRGRIATDRNGNRIPTPGGAPTAFTPTRCKDVVTRSIASRNADASAKRALANAKRTLDYYRTHHHQNSYDNRGGALVSVVHVGLKYANAFWSRRDNVMGYGDGDGVVMGDLTRAVDVAGHELTHGITSQTANLESQRESGALNEAFADFFGKMIANDGNWAIGKKVFLKSSAQGIRNLQNPNLIRATATRTYPKQMSEKIPEDKLCAKNNDYCGVHRNSTIWSHALYLVHQAIGRTRAEKLAFVTLTQYLTPTAKFSNAKAGMLRACEQLYTAQVCTQVRHAIDKTGII